MKLKELRGVSPKLVGTAEFKDLVIHRLQTPRELGIISVRNGLVPMRHTGAGDIFST
jgi:hypothetical protein